MAKRRPDRGAAATGLAVAPPPRESRPAARSTPTKRDILGSVPVDGVYRAVFVRMHPTGKAVLSLSESSQGQEAMLAQTAADELGIPPEDVKVVHEDADRFGEGNSFNSGPSGAVA